VIDGEITGDKKVYGWLGSLAHDIIRRIEIVIGVDTQQLSRRAQSKVHSATGRKTAPGELARAVAHGTFVKRTKGGFVGEVGLKGASKLVSIYGGSVEFGSTHPARIQESLEGAVMRFQVGGDWVFAKKVSIPAFSIPAHSFLRSALNEMRPKIMQDLSAAAQVDEAAL
jgi:hypothetical protein